MLDTVAEVNRAGLTVLMIEQNLVEAVRIAHDVVLLVGGTVRGIWDAVSSPILALARCFWVARSLPMRRYARKGCRMAQALLNGLVSGFLIALPARAVTDLRHPQLSAHPSLLAGAA